MQRARMADFLNALGAPNRRLAAVALPAGKRAVLDLNAAGDLVGTGAARPVSDLFSGIVSDITGKVVTTAVQANLRSAERQQELDRRVLPGIPSSLQAVYLALIVLGLFGVPVSRIWWQTLWPPEVADEYAGRIGYWAARAVRGACLWAGVPAADGRGRCALQPVRTDLGWRHDAGALVAPADGAQGPRRAAIDGAAASREPTPARDGPRSPPDDRARDWPVLDAARRLGNTRPSR